MRKTIECKRFLLLIAASFICGMLVRAVIINHNEPEFVFYRTFEPQFALVAEN